MKTINNTKKYQWITAQIKKSDPKKDKRIDSYSPKLDSIRVVSPPVKDWKIRNKIILTSPNLYPSIQKALEDFYKYRISLAIIKPKKLIDFVVEQDKSTWSKKHQQILNQYTLFGPQPKRLEKIPYKFSYIFQCNENRCKGHKLQILDWEIFQLFRNLRQKYDTDNLTILEKIRKKFVDEMWSTKRITYLFVGTVKHKPKYNVIGVYYPPEDTLNQTTLF